ncbi:MAG TPA: tetratricopeptide repeat protein [Burkholderiaceae bacterium]
MSTTTDDRGCAISGARPDALRAYERALAAFQGWRGGIDTHLRQALQSAPDFVMAHVMQAYLAICGRDPQRVRSARPLLARAAGLRANACERLHLAAIGAVLADDYEGAKATLGELLRREPRDALALQVAHSFDYVTGDAAGMRARVVSVLPAWSREMPGYHAVLSMHAFGLGECGDYERAEQVARDALALNPADARAHHAMAHVFEMSDRPEDGLQWMREHMACWSGDTLAATHCWWHLALFHLARGDVAGALRVYDERVRAGRSAEIADLIDASALLWRVRLQGASTGARWVELADAWDAHIDDGFCSFSDVHAMLAFVGAGDRNRAVRLERALAARQSLPTRHGRSTRRLGLPACRALMAFDRGDHATAVRLLANLSPFAGGLGGSHAQRDVLHLTLLHGIGHFRRPGRPVHGRRFGRAPSPGDHDDRSFQSRPARPVPCVRDRLAPSLAAPHGGRLDATAASGRTSP